MIELKFTGNSWEDIIHDVGSVVGLQLLQKSTTEARTEGEEMSGLRKFKVLKSPYPDINIGDVGVLTHEKEGGYALLFNKLFASGANPNDRTQHGRIIFFDRDAVEEIK